MPLDRLRRTLSTDSGLTVLLASLATVVFVIYPFVPLGGLGRLAVSLALTLILLSGCFSLSDRRRLSGMALVLAAGALVTRWTGHLFPGEGWLAWSHATAVLFLGLTVGGVLAKVMRPGRITSHRIQGAVAVYLMLGLTWAFAYSLVELQQPGSFDLPPATSAGATAGGRMADFVYFSFVTLTTLGYGDVTPLGSAARSLTILEALVGQLFLVILIARLVSLQVVHEGDP